MQAIVKRLHRKLGDAAENPTHIFTNRGVGYWVATVETQEQLDA